MTDDTVGGVHWSFWVIGAVALIWNVLGAVNLFVQMNADTLASFPESQRAIIEGRPVWATGGFAIGVFGRGKPILKGYLSIRYNYRGQVTG